MLSQRYESMRYEVKAFDDGIEDSWAEGADAYLVACLEAFGQDGKGLA